MAETKGWGGLTHCPLCEQELDQYECMTEDGTVLTCECMNEGCPAFEIAFRDCFDEGNAHMFALQDLISELVELRKQITCQTCGGFGIVPTGPTFYKEQIIDGRLIIDEGGPVKPCPDCSKQSIKTCKWTWNNSLQAWFGSCGCSAGNSNRAQYCWNCGGKIEGTE
jgi:hypothetical protein